MLIAAWLSGCEGGRIETWRITRTSGDPWCAESIGHNFVGAIVVDQEESDGGYRELPESTTNETEDVQVYRDAKATQFVWQGVVLAGSVSRDELQLEGGTDSTYEYTTVYLDYTGQWTSNYVESTRCRLCLAMAVGPPERGSPS